MQLHIPRDGSSLTCQKRVAYRRSKDGKHISHGKDILRLSPRGKWTSMHSRLCGSQTETGLRLETFSYALCPGVCLGKPFQQV